MILKIAWRNVWRTKVRSIVVITAIALGLWAGVFASAFVSGMMDQKIDNVIHLELSHLQVHHPEFRDELLPKYTIQNGHELISEFRNDPDVEFVSSRVIASPMMSSPKKSGAIRVTGISPEEETLITGFDQYVIEGEFFEGVKRNPILLSKKTAEEYQVHLRSKLVLTVQNTNGEISDAAFRVVGIFDTKNPMYDGMNAFVRRSDLQQQLGLGEKVHEIAVLLNAHDLADPVASKYQAKNTDLEVLSWMDLQPGMRYIIEAQDSYTVIIVGIILVALLFSIINTMLMAVLERVREIGMLMAVGMTKQRVFGMIMLETLFLACIGGPLGLLLSWAAVSYFGTHGIDLGGAAYGEMGFAKIVYPHLGLTTYLQVAAMVFGMAILAAIYPARKALKLIPVEAIRKL